MSDNIHLDAVSRSDSGKGASRRLRRQNLVPAIIYGGDNDPAQISLQHNEFIHQLENEAIYTQIIDLQVGSKTEEVILRDLQRHPYKNKILHADFYRIDNKKPIHIVVPIHVENGEECIGVRLDGGMLTQQMSEVEVVCLPKNLPEFLTIDATNVHLGEGLHLSDIAVPKGVEIVALTHGEDHDIGVLSVIKTRAASTDDEDSEAGAESEGDSEES
jgi:large subunit ribosomal protein L25